MDQTQNAESLHRLRSEALDAVLGKDFRVLDDGFVRVVDYMGTDDAIVQAARVSYGSGTKKLREDRALIRYLMRHAHTTPFEMCEIKLHVRVPMDCWRQWIRHRTANVNEYSTRYSVAIDAAQRTPPDQWRKQSKDNKQGSEGRMDETLGAKLSGEEKNLQEHARRVYEERLNLGVAREQARKDLPLSTYTESYWKVDLHNLLHFLWLRMDPHAQFEIREYANIIGNEIVGRWVPNTWQAFKDYRINGLVLSRIETELVRMLASGDEKGLLAYLAAEQLVRVKEGKPVLSGELKEFLAKLPKLGLKHTIEPLLARPESLAIFSV
ncbi:MAG: FAD-dependent thymidylate synthase [Ignavibacteria bacterium RIFCSPHIGHO2_02_FULL_56_12]|nr:MAG: FAD-dependent thymidylate synthase [Ignavibacteria bacterium RIFCSPHIGHO2_02_FULL_56_12]